MTIHIIESRNLNVSFIKVKGHSDDQLNDMADRLAKEGLDSLDSLEIDCIFDRIDFAPYRLQCKPI